VNIPRRLTETCAVSNTSNDINDLSHDVPSSSHPGNNPASNLPTIIHVAFNRVVQLLRYLCLGYPQQYSSKAHVVIRNMDASGLPLANFGKSWEDFLKSLSHSWNRSWSISIFLFTYALPSPLSCLISNDSLQSSNDCCSLPRNSFISTHMRNPTYVMRLCGTAYRKLSSESLRLPRITKC
jgi:hypothetical protein